MNNLNLVDRPAPAFYRTYDVLRITSFSRATLYRRILERRFPPPIHLGGRACGWRVAAIQEWIGNPDMYRAPVETGVSASRRRGRPRKYRAY